MFSEKEIEFHNRILGVGFLTRRTNCNSSEGRRGGPIARTGAWQDSAAVRGSKSAQIARARAPHIVVPINLHVEKTATQGSRHITPAAPTPHPAAARSHKHIRVCRVLHVQFSPTACPCPAAAGAFMSFWTSRAIWQTLWEQFIQAAWRWLRTFLGIVYTTFSRGITVRRELFEETHFPSFLDWILAKANVSTQDGNRLKNSSAPP